MSVKPVGSQVLCRVLPGETHTESGLFIPGSVVVPFVKAEVVAVGLGFYLSNGIRVSPEVSVGDTVMMPASSGSDITIDGEDLVIINEGHILGIVE